MGKANLSGKSGVYIIKNLIDDKVYIGSSLDLYSRMNIHKNKLKRFKHENQKLNNFCITYGFDKLIFEMLELCDKNIILEREQFYMDLYKSYNTGFNISKTSSYPYKDLTEEEIKERRKNFAEKIGVSFYVYDSDNNESYFKSLKDCYRKIGISCSKLSECLNNKDFHKEYVLSKEKLNIDEVRNLFTKSKEHFNKVKLQSIKNISKTKNFMETEDIKIHKHEIMNYTICRQLDNKVKSSFVYNKNTEKVTQLSSIDFNTGNYLFAPTQALLQMWLREVHKIHIRVTFDTLNTYTYIVYNQHTRNINPNLNTYSTYEQALEAGLVTALNLIKIKHHG